LSTNTYIKLYKAGTSTEVCTTEIHTSCSSDIVGTYGDEACGTDIIVSGWSDGNPVANSCDDGFDLCSCNGTFVDPPQDPYDSDTNEMGDYCFCSNIVATSGITSVSQLTPSPTNQYVKKKKGKGAKGKSRDSGYGFGDCDCNGGVNLLRFVYTGTDLAESITLYIKKLDGDEICSFTDVSYGEEMSCSIEDGPLGSNGEPMYSKLKTETAVRVVTANGNCEGSWHTSCSQDIIGWTAEGCDQVVVSGWQDNDSDPEECDDGFEPCDCPSTEDPCDANSGQFIACSNTDGCECDNEGCDTCFSTGTQVYSSDANIIYIKPIVLLVFAFIFGSY